MRDAMDVNRVCPIVKISWGTIFADKVSAIKFESTPDALSKLVCLKMIPHFVQGAQIIPSVKIIDPSLSGLLSIVP